jgi:hypothetical protein
MNILSQKKKGGGGAHQMDHTSKLKTFFKITFNDSDYISVIYYGYYLHKQNCAAY